MGETISKAIVVKSTGSWYSLRDQATGQGVMCRIQGKLRLKGVRSTNPVVVGDVVTYQMDDAQTGSIISIEPRRNYMIRRASNLSKESHIIAANIDQAFLVAAIAYPDTSYEFIDRFLVTAEAYHVPVTIILNKCDLYESPELAALKQEFIKTYNDVGYTVLELSAKTNQGVDHLRTLFAGKVSLLSGNSGVGKSTLVTALDPQLEVRVGDISDSHNKGKHTTTFSEMFELSMGGYIIDTPGIKGFGLIDIEPDEICRYFPDLFRHAPDCQFYNCTHTHEPGCAVKEALRSGEISENRYISYLKLLEDNDKYRK